MNKLIYALNIVSAIPGIVIIPLAPFAFFIVNGEGLVPGLLHEYAFIALLLFYPFLLLGCLWFSLSSLRRGRSRRALIAGTSPLVCALLLVWLLVSGGVQLT